ncbi:hypothetical protein CIHG_02912 [Coccidioides immitis H538.4]|uniref:Uncharacterized protein n=2 Tax=Coccidioides immitis TaxID=5501 RepID=A0A0J8RKG8_COCIT|nr:hypothetical protein CIRG_07622 [Coccidioides immitis RMSCC 2394]KMU85131.1 hypothetical protein CIHG_02912 [Coccidioides immitis H538.4]
MVQIPLSAVTLCIPTNLYLSPEPAVGKRVRIGQHMDGECSREPCRYSSQVSERILRYPGARDRKRSRAPSNGSNVEQMTPRSYTRTYGIGPDAIHGSKGFSDLQPLELYRRNDQN